MLYLFFFQFHQTLENKKETIKTLKTELAWSMTKQAEADYTKASKEMAQQEQKIEKANELIQKELKLEQDLKKETESIVEEKNLLTKECNEFETVLNGYKENLRLAKEGESNLMYFFLNVLQHLMIRWVTK